MVQLWSCPNCSSYARTVDSKVPMHPCRGLRGLMVPLVVDGTKVKRQVIERQDYVKKEKVQTDVEGRPVMSVVTTRNQGQDCTVFAPLAVGKKE